MSDKVVESFLSVDAVNIKRHHSIIVPTKLMQKPPEEFDQKSKKIFLNKIFEDQAQHHKKFIAAQKARSDFRIKESEYN